MLLVTARANLDLMAHHTIRKTGELAPISTRQVTNDDGAKTSLHCDIYKPLETPRSIRLLQVSLTDPSQTLTYTLVNTTLDSAANKYQALSYAWGEPGQEATININGQQFQIRRNLFDFFEELKHQRRECALWVDAICINQLDLDERNFQVQIMCDVYSSAQLVIVWLGYGSECTDHLFNISGDEEAFEYAPDGRDAPFPSDDELDGVFEVLRKSYWDRLWVVQEIALAKEVFLMCGGRIARFSNIGRLIRAAQEETQGSHFVSELNHRIREHSDYNFVVSEQWKFIATAHWKLRYISRGHSVRFLELFYDFGHMKCENILDKVYGFVGLLKQQPNPLLDKYLLVDYRRTTADLVLSVLDFCRGNNETVLTYTILYLVYHFNLLEHNSGTDRPAVTAHCDSFVGTISPETARGEVRLFREAPIANDQIDEDKDDWMRIPPLKVYATYMGKTAMLNNSTQLQPGDLLYSVYLPEEIIIRGPPRHSDSDRGVIALRVDAGQVVLVTVGVLYDRSLLESDFGMSGAATDQGDRNSLWDLRERRLFELFLRKARLEASAAPERKLAISAPLNHWIFYCRTRIEEALR